MKGRARGWRWTREELLADGKERKGKTRRGKRGSEGEASNAKGMQEIASRFCFARVFAADFSYRCGERERESAERKNSQADAPARKRKRPRECKRKQPIARVSPVIVSCLSFFVSPDSFSIMRLVGRQEGPYYFSRARRDRAQ